MRESSPAISTPTVVTVRTVHLYLIRTASCGSAALADVDVPVHEPLQLRDVLALLPDRLADVPFLDDEDQLVAGVHAIDDGRPGQVLEKRDVLDRLLVKDNLGHGLRR